MVNLHPAAALTYCYPAPCSYTTDFDEVEALFSKEINPNLDMTELMACLTEFRNVRAMRGQLGVPAALDPGGSSAKCKQQ